MIPRARSRRLAPAGHAALAAAAAALLVAGCGERPKAEAAKPAPKAEAPIAVTYADVTRASGVGFVHVNGARGRKYLPETMGSGVVVFDADNDDRPDLFFVNSAEWPEHRKAGAFQALYRNRGDGTFEDATSKAGLRIESYAIGAAAADYDNDGDQDLFLNALGPDRLFRNRGDGTFEDVTAKAGVGDPGFGSSATWIDYDRDGWLDLFVCNYVEWSPKTDIYCTLDGANKSYCTPESYKGATNRLFRNRGDGTFEDVTAKAGVHDPTGKSLGVVAFDSDDDGFSDLAVANDTQPNFLYRNRGDGTFEEIGRTAGIAFSEEGKARGAMGIDAADYDGSGRESLVIGNFSNEMLALYHNEGRGLFIDDAAAAGIGQPSLLTLAFGCFFFDYDLDGRLDIFVANGHVENEINAVQPSVTYAEPPHLFRGGDGGRFEETTAKVGGDLGRPAVARGAATGDLDGDGDLDIVVSANGGPAAIFRNDGGNAHRSVRLRLSGAEGKSNRDAIGARVRLTFDGRTQTRTVRSAASYGSQSEMVLTFGIGSAGGAGQVAVAAAGGAAAASGAPATASAEVRWPDGSTSTYQGIVPGRTVLLKQGEPAPR